jgi:hypothetical protein
LPDAGARHTFLGRRIELAPCSWRLQQQATTARAEPEVDHVWYAQHRPNRRIRLSGRVPAC